MCCELLALLVSPAHSHTWPQEQIHKRPSTRSSTAEATATTAMTSHGHRRSRWVEEFVITIQSAIRLDPGPPRHRPHRALGGLDVAAARAHRQLLAGVHGPTRVECAAHLEHRADVVV